MAVQPSVARALALAKVAMRSSQGHGNEAAAPHTPELVLAEGTVERYCHGFGLRRWTVAADPRPDLTDDATLWGRVLALAYDRHGADGHGVYGVLLGIRSMGVELTVGVDTLRLQPRTNDPGQPPRCVAPAEYREWRPVWLDPHRADLIRLLAEAAAEREISNP